MVYKHEIGKELNHLIIEEDSFLENHLLSIANRLFYIAIREMLKNASH